MPVAVDAMEEPLPAVDATPAARRRLPWRERLAHALDTLRDWPWWETVRTLRERFREDRLGLTAGSLTFTTLIALVPLATVTLALFAAFPIFSSMQGSLEKYFVQALVPDNIARPVLRALTQFASKANRLGTAGLLVLLATALSLVLTIDRTLNGIWRVRRPRPFGQRVLVYWAALTLGPLALGMSLSLTSYAVSSSRGVVSVLPGGVGLLLGLVEFVFLALCMAGLFHYVPNTVVRWRHALAGGVFVAAAFELAKQGLAWYVAMVPTFSVLYGAFATVPILLLWVYLGWVIVLLGAVIAAYAPSLQMRVRRLADTPGHRFELALGALRELARARDGDGRGLSLARLAETLRVDPLQLEPLIEHMAALDWLARLDEDGDSRLVLLADPARTAVAPLVQAWLLQPGAGSAGFYARAGLGGMSLGDALALPPADGPRPLPAG